jgi:enoyl-CoA hydratase/carnithine racemase
MPEFETLGYDEADGVAWVTLNRPAVMNSFNTTMQRELRSVWRWLRRHDPVRVVVLTGAGDKAFCTGIDRSEALAEGPRPGRAGGTDSSTPGAGGPDAGDEPVRIGSGTTPFMFDDPGENLGPKANDLWKPVIAAVNGIACGGAFYMLGEVDFMIAADHATFFDPHLTFNMAAAFEPLQMTDRMPFGDLVRLTLLGSEERMSAQRALQIGLVTEVVPGHELHERAQWAASVIAKAHPVAVQGTLRALWAGRELSRSQALGLGWAFVGLGNDPVALAEGQARFASGERVEWRLR